MADDMNTPQVIGEGQDKIAEEFANLLGDYRTTVRCTTGCGSRGQEYIDNAWADL